MQRDVSQGHFQWNNFKQIEIKFLHDCIVLDYTN